MLITWVQIKTGPAKKMRAGDNEQHHAAVLLPKRETLSTQKTQAAKCGATQAAKT